MPEIDRQLLPDTATLQDVLERLNEGVGGVVLVTDSSGRLVGLFTDGDARRAVLSGRGLGVAVTEVMNQQFRSIEESVSPEDRLKELNHKIRHLPVVDTEGRPVEVLSWGDLWKLPLVEPSLGGNELKYVTDCIRTNWISSQGAYVNRFEADFAAYHGVSNAITVSSGTTALHLVLEAMGIGEGDEVIIPDLTFGATANSVIHTGATPVLVDVREDDWSLCLDAVREAVTDRTKVVIPVHLYGVPADMKGLRSLADDQGFAILEDCAESLGATIEGTLSGAFGEASAFSFFANKTITTGEGGMILTEDDELADRLRLLRDHGMRKGRRYWHEEAGYNYRMTNMQSAVGCAQLERLEDFLAHRQKLGEAYTEQLMGIEGVTLQEIPEGRTSSFWLFSIILSEELGFSRDKVMELLLQEGVETRPLFYPLHEQPAYCRFASGHYPVATKLSRGGMSLPTSNHMEVGEVDQVCRALRRILSRAGISNQLEAK